MKHGIGEGSCATLIQPEVIDGKTYIVDLMNDHRVNKGVPYVIVMMKETENIFDNWTHYVAKSVEL